MHKRHADKLIIEISGVSKSFGSKSVLSDVNLAVRAGEIFGFLGPNGAGKTTTIKVLLDILRPTAGRVGLFGASNRQAAAAHRRMGYLSGDMVLDEDLTGRQYLDFVGHMYGGDHSAERQKLIDLLQADVDVKIGNYSRGNKQKIGLIAAMMHQPELLILDEPSSGFDPLVQEVFIKLIQDYRQAGGTVFMSSHTLGEVQRLCDRVAFIRSGHIVATEEVDELNKKAAKQIHLVADAPHVAAIRGAASHLPGLVEREVDGRKLSFSYHGAIQPLLAFFAAFELDDLTIREPDMEEIFMTYYQSGGATQEQQDV